MRPIFDTMGAGEEVSHKNFMRFSWKQISAVLNGGLAHIVGAKMKLQASKSFWAKKHLQIQT